MSASVTATFFEFLRNLFGSEEEANAFLAAPSDYLDAHGLSDLSCADFDDALVAFVENDGRGDVNQGGTFHNTVQQGGESEHDAIARHLTEIVNNTYITNEDNDVYNDQSFNGTVIADGDVKFDYELNSVVASGDGAVAAGEDINGPTNTGDIDAEDSGVNFGAGGDARGGDDTTDSFNSDDDTTTTNTSTTTNTATTNNLNNVGNESTSTTEYEYEESFNNETSNDGDDGNANSGNTTANAGEDNEF